MKFKLVEDRDLHKGIFWVKDINDIEKSAVYMTSDCDSNGSTVYNSEFDFTSKDGLSYNHENTWNKLDGKTRENKKYNYFPRGRVEIRNGVATIFCSQYIYGDELKNWCVDKFNLTQSNGIKRVDMKADNSNHYKCYLD